MKTNQKIIFAKHAKRFLTLVLIASLINGLVYLFLFLHYKPPNNPPISKEVKVTSGEVRVDSKKKQKKKTYTVKEWKEHSSTFIEPTPIDTKTKLTPLQQHEAMQSNVPDILPVGNAFQTQSKYDKNLSVRDIRDDRINEKRDYWFKKDILKKISNIWPWVFVVTIFGFYILRGLKWVFKNSNIEIDH